MSSSPRIYRAVPQGPITKAEPPIAVIATMQWQTGDERVLPAVALAWTRDAVQVSWTPPVGGTRTDWIPAHTVRRAEGTDLRPRDSDPDETTNQARNAPTFDQAINNRPPSSDPPRNLNRRRPRW